MKLTKYKIYGSIEMITGILTVFISLFFFSKENLLLAAGFGIIGAFVIIVGNMIYNYNKNLG